VSVRNDPPCFLLGTKVTLATVIEKSYLLATGKGTAPASTSSKYTKIVGLANICQDAWQNEPHIEWDSLYLIVSLAATVTATDTFALSASIREISNRDGDFITILRTDGGKTYYELVKPNELQDNARAGKRVVARIGSNLVFSIAFEATEPEIGGTIKVPAYGFVSTLSNSTDVVQVDNPLWLCYMTAAEYCRTDLTLNYREDGLIARANEIMQDMKEAQESNNPEPIRRWSALGRSWS
jgi:hypothetical protein